MRAGYLVMTQTSNFQWTSLRVCFTSAAQTGNHNLLCCCLELYHYKIKSILKVCLLDRVKRVQLILHLGGVTIYCEAGRVVAPNAGLGCRTELKDSFIAGLGGTRTLARKLHRNQKQTGHTA